MSKLNRRPGYTLLELLISIAIFAGVMVLALGAFARSANSSAKSNIVREKSEAARSLIDQISNDFRYIDKNSRPSACTTKAFCLDPTGFEGFPTKVRMSIKYPGQDTYVMKTYYETAGTNPTVKVQEYRGCTLSSQNALICSNPTTTTILDKKYLLGNQDLPNTPKVFDGSSETAVDSGSLSINIVLKPATAGASCDVAGTCYELKTTLVPGAI